MQAIEYNFRPIMIILGIESTCDESGVALVEGGRKILSNQVYSQSSVHAATGGVIPEVASRLHVKTLPLLLEESLKEANLPLEAIDAVAIAHGPGLIGALLVGLQFAKGLSIGLKKPLIAVNHVEAHLFAALMNGPPPPLPALGIVVSGGHTSLLLIKKIGSYELLGETIDDAIGEAFDKVACRLGLPYPGGAALEKMATSGDPHRFPFRSGRIKDQPLNFSFSGLKTALLMAINKADKKDYPDLAASFQEAAFSDLFAKIQLAIDLVKPASLLVGGGVAGNQTLIRGLDFGLPLLAPPKELTLDNAAMIAGLGFFNFMEKGPSPITLAPKTRIAFDKQS